MNSDKPIIVYSVEVLDFDAENEWTPDYPAAFSNQTYAVRAYRKAIKDYAGVSARIRLIKYSVLNKGRKWLALRIVDKRGWMVNQELLAETHTNSTVKEAK